MKSKYPDGKEKTSLLECLRSNFSYNYSCNLIVVLILIRST